MKQFRRRSIFSPLGLLLLLYIPSVGQEVDSTFLDLLSISQKFKDEGKYDSAIVYIEQALQDSSSLAHAQTLRYERAKLYSLNGAYSQSESIFQELYTSLQERGDQDSLFAEVLHGIGSQKYNLGAYAEARRYLEDALSLKKQLFTELHTTVAITYNALGNLVSDEGDLDLARTYYEKALEIRKQVLPEDHPHISDTYQNLGILEYLEEDFEAAIQLIKKSFEIEKRIYPPDHPLIASTFNNLGVMYDVMGNTPRALEYYRESLKIRRKNLGEKHPAVGQSYHNLGVVYQQYGDLRKALANLFQSLYIFQEVFENENNEEIATNLETIGNVYEMLGENQEAETYFQQALNIFSQIFPSNHPSIGKMMQNLGVIYRKLGSYEKAHRYFAQAKVIYENLSHTPGALAILYKEQAMLFALEERYEEALVNFDKGDEIYTQSSGSSNVDRVILLNEKANTYLMRKDTSATKRTYQEAIGANLPDFSPNDVNQVPPIEAAPVKIPSYIESLNRKAFLHAKENSTQSWKIAKELWKIGLHWLGKLQDLSTYRASKLDVRSQARDMCEASVETHIKLLEKTGDKAYLVGAYQLAEYSQTALLHEWMQEIEARQQAGIPSELIEKVQDYNSTISFYEKKLYETRGGDRSDSLSFIQIRTRLFEVRNSLDSLVSEIEKSYPTYYEVKYQREPLDLSAVQTQLSSEEQLIRYFLTSDKLYLFSIRRSELSHYSFDIDSTFYQESLRLYEFVQTNPSESLQKEEDVLRYLSAAHKLYGKLLAPAIHDNTQKLYVIPDGILNYLPFEVLLSEPVEEFEGFSDLPYAFKAYEISYAYSSRLLFSEESKTLSPSFLGFAPEYGQNIFQNASSRFVDSTDIGRLPPLVYNQSEVESLQSLMRGQVFLGKEAREQTFKQQAPQAGILHLAMHALTDDVNPLYSGLVFSQVDSLFDDNFLYTYELFNMHLNADLAVLSACNTGIGEIQRGEGMLSLAKGFQYAGCPNLVMSLWQTDDKVAYQVMNTFYAKLLEGGSYSEALREAKINYLETQDRTHPFYWATFLYVGQRASISKPLSFWWLVGIIGIIGILGILIWKKRNT
ncbi:MAG: tetratricopeptide repeat protein [Bacteroidota bacterium]